MTATTQRTIVPARAGRAVRVARGQFPTHNTLADGYGGTVIVSCVLETKPGRMVWPATRTSELGKKPAPWIVMSPPNPAWTEAGLTPLVVGSG